MCTGMVTITGCTGWVDSTKEGKAGTGGRNSAPDFGLWNWPMAAEGNTEAPHELCCHVGEAGPKQLDGPGDMNGICMAPLMWTGVCI